MCYSAQVWEDHHKFVTAFGADVSIQDYVRLYARRSAGEILKIPKAMDSAFANANTVEEREVFEMIQEFDRKRTTQLEQDLFKAKNRLIEAERKLKIQETSGVLKERDIATSKIAKTLGWLADSRRSEVVPKDSRIFPLSYAPVMVWEQGRRVVKPMRYQCRPQGKPAIYDTKYPDTYNARRDSLEKLWHREFGYTHGIIAVNAFYENVERAIDGEKKNVVLEFKPEPQQELWVACLWSHWQVKGEQDLWSFATITDAAPAEIASAGHDRCIIPIKAENIDAWLNPDPKNLAATYAILDDRVRSRYEHRMAA
ncbi:MAG: SOS response-associated peptidase family protein [Arenimonas sp.]